MNTILRVNVAERRAFAEAVPEAWKRLGGRALVARILLDEVPPACEPTGRKNKLVFAPGLLADTAVTTAGQMSVGGKSPLTGGVKESNVGGHAGKRLARLGLKAMIVEGSPKGPALDVLRVAGDGAELVPMPELARLEVSATVSALRTRFGKKIGIFCIGPAGEMLMYGAGIACPDDDDVQMRYAARGGLGAVMGSKGLKAIVIDDSGSTYVPASADPELLKATSAWMVEALLKDPKTENRNQFGTPAILALANSSGLLPTRNFSSGSFEGADLINGERVREVILARGGEGGTGKPCVRGCVIQCSNVFPAADGKRIVASIQYENISLLGSNCGIGSLDDIAELNQLCNQVGVDAIETGAALGVAMEAGVVAFGDAAGAKDLVRQIGKGTWLGRILGNGARVTGQLLGVRRVPVVKGQAIPGYDPRALKGNGVTYVTSPMGADHTAGNAFETLKTLDPLGTAGQVEASRKLQIRAAFLDSVGLCLFVRPPFVKHPEKYADLLKGRYGWDLGPADIVRIGYDALMAEREFNRRSGASEEFHPMAEFMEDEGLPPTGAVFDVSMEEMGRMWDGYVPGAEL